MFCLYISMRVMDRCIHGSRTQGRAYHIEEVWDECRSSVCDEALSTLTERLAPGKRGFKGYKQQPRERALGEKE